MNAIRSTTNTRLKFVKENPAKKFIVATEVGIIHQMKKNCPDKI
ncbi:MAG: quinolinate synthase NadA, partial [Leptonema sp. (in: bacteria)]